MLNILLVDDEHLVLDMLSREINWQGLGISGVYTAQSARQAMDIFLRKPVDIMLCDIEMPQKSGLELLRNLQEHQLDVVCILLTAHADFQYAREAVSLGAMDYIIKPAPVSEIEKVIARAVERVKEKRRTESDAQNGRRWAVSRNWLLRHFWHDAISGQIGQGRAELAAERASRCIETPLDEQYMLLCCMLRLPSDDRSGLAGEEMTRVVQDIMMNMTGAEAVVASQQNTWTAILPGTGPEQLAEREALAGELLSTLNEHQQLYMMACLVDQVPAEEVASQVRLVYRRVHDRVDDSRLLVFERPLRPVPEADRERGAIPDAPFATWQKMLRSLETERLVAQVYDYLFGLGSGEPVPESTLSAFLHDYLQMVYSVLTEVGIQSAALLEGDGTVQALMSRATAGLNDLRLFCGTLSGRCAQLMAAARDEMSVSEQIRRYVAGHLGEELNRDTIAAQVGFSPEYVSRLFKQETGMNLVNYIQTERINTACSLLLNTDLSVSDIAAQTGYDNFAYFSKAFRKHTGETPSSYRKGQ